MYDAQIKNLVTHARCTVLPLKRFQTVDDIAMDALVMDESSSLSWFSFRANVDPNFELGRESLFQ